MKLKRSKLHLNKSAIAFLENEIVQELLHEYNAYISGGLAIEMSRFKHADVAEYLGWGDVDVYFRCQDDFEAACKKMLRYSDFSCDSPTGLCKNFNIPLTFWPKFETRKRTVKFQLIGLTNSLEKTFEQFDFTNCRIAYDKHGFIYDSDALQLNKDNCIKVNHSLSPFLISRVAKYIKYKSFEKITPDSKQHITEWLVKARNGIWDDPSLNINWFNGSCLMQNPIQEMFEYRDVISDADLLLLLGKIKLRKHVRSSRHYNRLILGPEVDIALQELKRRKNERI